MRLKVVCLMLLLAPVRAALAAGDPPAGVVMALSGSTMPALAPMSEIPSGVPIKLAPDAELTLLDYARCKTVRVSGGTVTMSRFDFLADGKILSQVDAPCPRVHQLSAGAAGSIAGGLVMRSIASAPKWPLNPELVIVGDGAAGLKTAVIFADGRLDSPLMQLDVSGRSARYPAGAAALPANERYVLRLTLAGRAEPVDISFIGSASTGPSLIVVLRDS
ncbi:MAG: hypothetical protein JO001_16860 [Alphaproteobacteria bacterium]|nr:hypothetical protein [Alphaproteobacteria bacterium]